MHQRIKMWPELFISHLDFNKCSRKLPVRSMIKSVLLWCVQELPSLANCHKVSGGFSLCGAHRLRWHNSFFLIMKRYLFTLTFNQHNARSVCCVIKHALSQRLPNPAWSWKKIWGRGRHGRKKWTRALFFFVRHTRITSLVFLLFKL